MLKTSILKGRTRADPPSNFSIQTFRAFIDKALLNGNSEFITSFRTDIPKKIEQITDNMDLITWNQLHRI